VVSILAAGDNVVDCYATAGRMFPGGNAVNVSAFARQAGAETAYLGTVGTDTAGELLTGSLRAEGVSLRHLRVVDGETAYCIIGTRDGDRVFLESFMGVSQQPLEQLLLASAGEYDAVHTSQSSGLDASVPAMSALSNLSYDFSTRDDRSHREAIAPFCYLASFSGGSLSRHEVLELAQEAVALGSTWALVTRGSDGAVLAGREGTWEAAAFPIDVVDTLGAGDTFIAHTLAGLLGGAGPDAVLGRAARAAAATCRRLGAFGDGALLDINHPISRDSRAVGPLSR
jgi:fructoselysine 6-kinase